MRWFLLLPVVLFGCSMKTEERHAGSGAMAGSITGLTLACDDGVSIARSFPPSTEIKVAPNGVSCETVRDGDHVTIDLGDSKPGTYTVVKGFPIKADLSSAQARAHICPAKPEGQDQPPCHDVVRSGRVTVTKFDDGKGGRVEGTYELELADGKVSGTFSAYRCD
jgi:hypothetical protein